MRRLLGGLSLALVVAGCTAPSSVDLKPFPNRLELAADGGPVPLETRSEKHVFDFGDAEANAFLGDGWSLEGGFETDDGGTFLWGLGESSTLDLFVLEPRDLEATVRAGPYRWDGAPPNQTVTVELNGREVASLRLKPGAREYRFTFPKEAQVVGRNEVRWRYAYSGVPAEVEASPTDTRPLAVAWDFLRLGGGTEPSAPQSGGGELRLGDGTEIRYYLTLPAASVLTFDAVEHRGRLIVEVVFEGSDRVLRREWKTPCKEGAALELATRGDRLARITFRAIADDAGEDGEAALVVRGPSVRTGEPILAAATEPAPPKAAAPRPNVLLYLVDTLRADHLGAYGYPKPVSPRIDAFARDAVVFDHALANSSWTRSAMASVMTGLLPSTHGVHTRHTRLAAEAVTLAELLSAAGYDTAAFVTSVAVTQVSGLDAGFDDFHYLVPKHAYIRSDAVNKEVFSWLSERPREKPFFLYIHTLDPHGPYAAPPPFTPKGITTPELEGEARESLNAEITLVRDLLGDGPDLVRLGSDPWIRTLSLGVVPVDDGLVKDMTALYDAEISFSDHSFGALLDRLREEGLAASTVVIFLSDHGEELYDHGDWSHGKTLYQEMLRVPWILRFPESSGMPHGVRVAELAQQVDILPTLADYLGLPLAPPIDGRSLMPWIRGRGGEESRPPHSFAQLGLDGRFALSLVEGHFKLLCADLADCRLYDLQADPAEQIDIAERHPLRAEYLRASLRKIYGQGAVLTAPPATLDDVTRKRLMALGYL